jgi:hypothetical protein
MFSICVDLMNRHSGDLDNTWEREGDSKSSFLFILYPSFNAWKKVFGVHRHVNA